MHGYPPRLSRVSRKRCVPNRGSGYTRYPHVFSKHSRPVPVSHRNPFPQDMIHCCTRLGDHPAEISVLWNARRREPEIDTTTRAHARPPSNTGWCTVRGGLGPLEPIGRIVFLHIDMSTLIDLCIPLEREPSELHRAPLCHLKRL